MHVTRSGGARRAGPACGRSPAVQLPRAHVLLVHRPGRTSDERCAALSRADVVSSVHVAATRIELLAHLAAAAQGATVRPELVVVAHDPPWIDGVEVARTVGRIVDLRDADAAERQVVVIDAEDAAVAIDAVRAGVAGVVLSPTGSTELVATVTSVVTGSCVVPRTAAGRLVTTAPRPPREQLSVREIEVLEALSRGLTNGEIATALYVSRETVKTHVAHVLRKLGVGDRHAAAQRAIALGLLGPAGPAGPAADDPARTTAADDAVTADASA